LTKFGAVMHLGPPEPSARNGKGRRKILGEWAYALTPNQNFWLRHRIWIEKRNAFPWPIYVRWYDTVSDLRQ